MPKCATEVETVNGLIAVTSGQSVQPICASVHLPRQCRGRLPHTMMLSGADTDLRHRQHLAR